MRLLAIDPGYMTGVVIFDAAGIATGNIISDGQIPYEEIWPWLSEHITDNIDVIVLERFTISVRTIKQTRVEETLDVIGGVKCLAALLPEPIKVHRQNPSDAKTAYTDARLKELGFKVTGRHAKDALRHALLYTHRSV